MWSFLQLNLTVQDLFSDKAEYSADLFLKKSFKDEEMVK